MEAASQVQKQQHRGLSITLRLEIKGSPTLRTIGRKWKGWRKRLNLCFGRRKVFVAELPCIAQTVSEKRILRHTMLLIEKGLPVRIRIKRPHTEKLPVLCLKAPCARPPKYLGLRLHPAMPGAKNQSEHGLDVRLMLRIALVGRRVAGCSYLVA